MPNYFCIILSSIMLLQICSNSIIAHKIDSAISLINSELISSTITEESKLQAYNYDDISFLAIDHEKLMYLVEYTLDDNLTFSSNKVQYYFYNSMSFRSCAIGYYACNSVQMRILIKYQNKTYKEEIRYEPTKI